MAAWALLFVIYWFATWSTAKGDSGGDAFLACVSVFLAVFGLVILCLTSALVQDNGAAYDGDDSAMPVDDVPDSTWQRLRHRYTFSPQTLSFKRKPRRNTAARADAARNVVGLKLQPVGASKEEERLRQFELAAGSWTLPADDNPPAQPLSPTRSYSEPVYMLENSYDDATPVTTNRTAADDGLADADGGVYEEDDYLSVITMSDVDTSEISV